MWYKNIDEKFNLLRTPHEHHRQTTDGRLMP